MTVRDYYYANFDRLSDDKKFHFATRIKNFFKSDDFEFFFANYVPDTDLRRVIENNDFSKVNRAEERWPFFEKYNQLFGIEAALFRVMHLMHEYNLDLRSELVNVVRLDDLYRLADDLLADDEAIVTLSSWAVNVICLTEVLFPRGRNVVKELGKKALAYEEGDPLLMVYLYTHIIICDSEFYVKRLGEVELDRALLARASEVIVEHFEELILDVRLEFLVCARMAEVEYPEIRKRVAVECDEILRENPFLFDKRLEPERQTLDGAEHTNVLYIMSGLDGE